MLQSPPASLGLAFFEQQKEIADSCLLRLAPGAFFFGCHVPLGHDDSYPSELEMPAAQRGSQSPPGYLKPSQMTRFEILHSVH